MATRYQKSLIVVHYLGLDYNMVQFHKKRSLASYIAYERFEKLLSHKIHNSKFWKFKKWQLHIILIDTYMEKRATKVSDDVWYILCLINK